ncbi:hypothetical protein [Sharpea azabuensis]|uniref:hypothetical protein n=1 Tax=Sharpea azabuensis TaxID=322505 RepID=UPI00240A3BFF|nr:hypothetical protein [Sharpea azabuensis]MDD6511697.1 hypothetical protein [Sharpea azabuensis]
MKYQKEIMRPYRGKFKDLNLYEKIFLIVLISDASLFAVFSFLNNKIGLIVTFAIILFWIIIFAIKRHQPEEQERLIKENNSKERMKQMIKLLNEFHIDISDDNQLDRLIERATKEQKAYDIWKDFKVSFGSMTTYILLPMLTLLLQKIFDDAKLMDLIYGAFLIFLFCIMVVALIFSCSSIFKDLFNKDIRNLKEFIEDIEDIKDFHNEAFLIKQGINGK